ncbi:unnamed protein product [Leptidea sinapis]|uniref:ADP/ATP translocase n=1 Tax=Leptidea sinapis TaxID=189913 RepID=A0A5E4PRG4_9NEOP|nr:unnamed protein product [Leptidea sinapis]
MALKVEQTNDLNFIARNLLAGGIAGMCAKTTVAPLDRIKILLQAQSSHYKHHGVFGGLMAIVKQESFIALYKGNGAQMVRIFPYAATQFTSFEIYKKHGDKFVAGAGAGVTSVTLTYPLDTIRARLAFQISGEHRYTGILLLLRVAQVLLHEVFPHHTLPEVVWSCRCLVSFCVVDLLEQ